MQIGLMSINDVYYNDTFCKLTREKQKEFMTRGVYAHMDKKTLEIKLNKALKNVPYASKRAKKQAKKTDTSGDRRGSESDNIDRRGTDKAKEE